MERKDSMVKEYKKNEELVPQLPDSSKNCKITFPDG